MKKIFFALGLILSSPVILLSQIINKTPLSPRITGYKIDARLNVETRSVEGNLEAFWVNQTKDVVPDIQLHMYMNAFKSGNSTFYREADEPAAKKSADRGRIDLKSFTLNDGTDLLPLVKYIHPDDTNKSDSTVIDVILPAPARPGDTVKVRIEFITKFPKAIRRTGFNGNFCFAGQWFPKFGVYEPAGMRYRLTSGWNCHQFHANSEFYSYHSVYDVKITVPRDYVVGTGGMLISESEGEGNTKTQTWRAEDIVDFAWTAWPGYDVVTDQWKHVKITLLIPKTRREQVARQLVAVKNALEYLERNVGPYPWPHLTFVDPPAIGSGAGGMEYTTLFTSDSFYIMPAGMHVPEMVTVHEFGHAYFMGILASNEFEEPWMDEGINSFFEERILDHYWGENSGMIDLPFFRMSDKSGSRLSYVQSPSRQVISNKEYSWNYPHGTYGMMSYQKTATWLYTMMGIIGEEATNDVFREYYRRWAFKHPSAQDLINVVNDVVRKDFGDKFGPDMNWFFDETLFGTGICDYKVIAFRNRKPVENTGKDTVSTADTAASAAVRLERAGEVILPVDVLVRFKDGTRVLEQWDGKSRFKDYKYFGGKQIEWVKIDPEYKIRMDVNFINNSATEKPDRIPVRRFTDKMISFLQFFINIVTL
jgi:hypothetical protein